MSILSNLPIHGELPLPKRLWWPWDQPVSQVRFQKSFGVNQAAAAKLYVACSGEYQARLDDEALTTPVSHLPSWRSIHIYPAALSPGEHQLVIEAFPGQHGQPFLMAALDWEEDNGAFALPTRLASDASWQMTALPGEEQRPAWAFDGVWAEPWGMPCNVPDDFCRLGTGWQAMRRERLARVAHLYPGVPALGAAIRVYEDGSLEVQPPRPYPLALPRIDATRPRLEWYRTREAHSLINNTWLDLFETRCPHVVFDAGEETFARLQVRLRRGGAALIAITTGESFHEVNRYARRVTDLIALQEGETFTTTPTGFRFVKVIVLSGDESCDGGKVVVTLDPIEIQHIYHPVEASGQFQSSDDSLNAIFKLCARTLHLCLQNEIWDGIKRDQLPWMGDVYTEALAAYTLFGDYRLARRSLAVLAEIGPVSAHPLADQRYPGLTAIWKTASGDINDIPAYTLWWLVGLWDYWMYSGDHALLIELKSEIETTLAHIGRSVGADGLWRWTAGWDFVDWAPLTPQHRAIYCHLLATRAIRQGADLLAALGQDIQPYRDQAKKMSAAARNAWCAHGQWDFGPSHHTNAQAICSRILRPDEAGKLFEQSLRTDPAMSMTYWHRYLDLAAASQVDAIGWGLAYIRRHWGQALQMGMTTLWEAFDPAWMGVDPHGASMIGAGYARYGGYETSLCHGWSAGAAVWLQNAVLGIKPEAPGFRSFGFRPNLGDLDWAQGVIPTPEGPINVRLRSEGRGYAQTSQRPTAWLEAPHGLEAIISAETRQTWDIHTMTGDERC